MCSDIAMTTRFPEVSLLPTLTPEGIPVCSHVLPDILEAAARSCSYPTLALQLILAAHQAAGLGCDRDPVLQFHISCLSVCLEVLTSVRCQSG